MKKLVKILPVVIVVIMVLTVTAAAADIEGVAKNAQTTILTVASTIILIATGAIIVPMFLHKNNVNAIITLLIGGTLSAIVKNIAWIEAIGQSLATKWLG